MTMRLMLAASSAALLLAACGDNDQNAVDATQDAASVPVGQTSAAVMGANSPDAYVTNAAIGDMYEIQAAEIALERSENAEVRELAEMIRTDHTQASERMMALAPEATPDTALPTQLDERRQGLIDNLRSASAAAFDGVYIDQQVAAHREAVTLHDGFGDNADAPTLAEHARTVLPRIQAHLERSEAIDESLDQMN